MISADVIRRFNKGDEVALKEIYNSVFKVMSQTALRYVPEYVVGEIVSDVIMSVWKKRESLLTSDHIEGTVVIAVRNTCLNFLRKERTNGSQDLEEPIQETTEADSQDITDFLKYLSKSEKQVFVERFERKKSLSEIASDTGRSVQTVKNILNLAKNRLKKIVKEGYKPKLTKVKEKKRPVMDMKLCAKVHSLKLEGYTYPQIETKLETTGARYKHVVYLKNNPHLVNSWKEQSTDITIEACNLKSKGYTYSEINKILNIGNSYIRIKLYVKINPTVSIERFMGRGRQKFVRLT